MINPDKDKTLLKQVEKIGGYSNFKAMRIEKWEKWLIASLLRAVGGNRTELAKRIGLDRGNLVRKIRELFNK